MRKLRKLSIAVVLSLALAPCAFAGITDTPPAPGIIDSPPAPSEASGIIPTTPDAPSDLIVDAGLTLLQLLSVF